MNRDSFGSRFGAILAMAGSAVGLGNLWRFPYLVGENGGAAFIIVYFIFSFCLCIPIFISEFIIGRRTQQNAFGAFNTLSGGSAWKYLGLLMVLIPLIITSYYSVIGGWSIQYFFKSLTFSFSGHGSQEVMSTMFADYVSNPWLPLLGHTIFLLASAVIVMFGIKGGIEKFSKLMMPVLFLIVIGIAIYSISLPGAEAGLNYLFKPDFSKITVKSCATALGQAFFSLSLGMGCIITYGSYVSKKENILTQSVSTATADICFAICAGMSIMPAVFAFGIDPQSGPGLVFETLPFVFSQMPAGGFIAIIFFIALIVAAITSSISMFEVAIAYLVEERKMNRRSSCLLFFLICWIAGIFCSLSFGPLKNFKIFDFTLFNLFDYVTSNILLTLGSLLMVIFVGWRLKKTDIYDEFTNGGTLSFNVKLFGAFWFLIRYICPVAILIVFVFGIM